MIDSETIAVYDAQVEAYDKMVDDQPANQHLLDCIRRVTPGGLVLDLGCGPADASATMRSHGLMVDPVDASAHMVQLANRKHDIGARQASFDQIDGVHRYAGIWASFSLLHASASEFPVLLQSLHRATQPDGHLSLSMKTGTGSKRDALGRFYTYYSQEALYEHLHGAGFHTTGYILGEGPGLAGDIEPWITVTATA